VTFHILPPKMKIIF